MRYISRGSQVAKLMADGKWQILPDAPTGGRTMRDRQRCQQGNKGARPRLHTEAEYQPQLSANLAHQGACLIPFGNR